MAIQTVTFEGVPEGSCLAVPPHEIPDACARYIQDFLLDEAGLLRNRGTVQPAATVATFTDNGVGIAQAMNPAGIHKVGVLHGAGSFAVTSDDYTTTTDVNTSFSLSSAPYSVVDTKAALGGGSLIGICSQYGGAKQLAYWRGSDRITYGTGTATVVRGSTSVTGSGTAWAANVGPGMFFYATSVETGALVYIGVVLSVQSDTALTLESAALFNATGAVYSARPLRGVFPHYRCRLTTQTTTATVTGSSTKFTGNGVGQGTSLWYAYRASDNAYIGKVLSTTNDTTLTLTANAAIGVTVEDCILVRGDQPATIASPAVGALNAVYGERQFYADGINLYYTEAGDFEALDLDPNSGNFVPVSSSKVGAASRPITGIAPAYNSMLITKENEAFALVGPTPSQYVLRKLQDDGALSGMSIQVYDGNVIFAGREGIYSFDGQQVNNLVQDRLGDYYKSLLRTFDPTTYRMWSMVVRDHYFLFIESVTASYGPHKGSTINLPTRMTISVYLPTRAVGFHTNMDIRGSIELPASTGKGSWYLVNTASGARICSATDFFETTARDSITCTGNTAGPDFYIESKRYGLGDDLRKKLFKQLALEYYVGGDNLKMDTVTGLNDNGTTSISQWIKTILAWDNLTPVASTWDSLAAQYKTWDDVGQARFAVKRIKFLKRSQHLGFRIYMASTNVTAVKLGPWSLGFKLQREGRV